MNKRTQNLLGMEGITLMHLCIKTLREIYYTNLK